MLTVADFFGSYQVNSPGDLKEVLSRRAEVLNANAFSMAPGDGAVPFLGIFVKGDQAVLQYMGVDSSDLAISQGKEPYGNATFYETKGGGTIDFPAEAIVPMSVAVDAAVEFFNTQARPKCIRWLEL